MAISSGDELVDVVDDADQVVATVTRAEMRKRRLQHRAVFVAVIGSDGRLLAHRRSDEKDVWPGWWDIAAGGVVAAGEHYDDAAVREVGEELGITGASLDSIGAGRYIDDDVALFGRVYRCRSDGPFAFTDGEIAEVRWVDRAALDQLLGSEPFVPDSLALVLPLLDL